MLKRPDAHEASASVDRASGVGFASFPRGLGDAAALRALHPRLHFSSSSLFWKKWTTVVRMACVRAVFPTGEFCVHGCLSFGLGHQPFLSVASLARYMPSLVITTSNKQQKRNRASGFFLLVYVSTCALLNIIYKNTFAYI
jgi:hypothetical protein